MSSAAPSITDRNETTQQTFLISFDLEDDRMMFPGGERFRERVPENTYRFLEFMAQRGARCTFFTTGDVARRYPSLVADVAAQGHEIACHTSEHTVLDKLDPRSFRLDLERCRTDFERAGVPAPIGFRAPCASLVERTAWAYDVLADAGYTYSSSVFAARNPQYGWPDFGTDRPTWRDRIWELPMTLSGVPGLQLAFVSGVYFRVLPLPVIRALFRRRVARGDAPVGYLHPFDLDTEQERFEYPELKGNPLLNRLMYVNRGDVLRRLDGLIGAQTRIVPYRDYVATSLS